MLYLRTGGNGSGKTLLTLKDVRELQLKTKRPVCFNLRPANHPEKPNTPYCNLKPSVIEEFGWKGIHFKDWEEQESGTIFLIDECHYDMPKGGTAKPPQHIERLTEHRSRGFDFFLLTQHPSNIDVFVRKLVQAPGWHQHIKRLAGALAVANVVQWDAVNLQCEQAGSGKSGEVKTRPYPRDVYKWYDSAELHTGKVRIPKAAIILALCVVAVPLLFMRGISTVAKTDGSEKPSHAASIVPVSGANAAARPRTAAELVEAHRPRIEGLMHTAAVYDPLTAPKRVPVPAACISTASKGCKCWTQDATVYPTTPAICAQIVTNGVFLHFAPDPLPVQPVALASGDKAGGPDRPPVGHP